ncbi:MAG: electron transport complex subunit RsxC, partial [Planctomycetota bacterium]
MSPVATDGGKKGAFHRGVHPPEGKAYSADKPIKPLPAPPEVFIATLQHTGAPCEPVAEPKQEVVVGEMIGQATAFVSAPIHATINGVIAAASVATLPNGRHVSTIPIKAGDEQLSEDGLMDDAFRGEWPTRDMNGFTPEQIVEAVQNAG